MGRFHGKRFLAAGFCLPNRTVSRETELTITPEVPTVMPALHSAAPLALQWNHEDSERWINPEGRRLHAADYFSLTISLRITIFVFDS